MNILVTGGASGLGAAIVRRLARDNINQIYFTYAHSATAAKKIEAELPNVKSFFCDFTNSNSIDEFLDTLMKIDIDALINNAGISIHKEHFHKTKTDIFETNFLHSILPCLQITQVAIKIFRKKKFGKIINILSSAIVNKPPVGWSSYVAGKSYLMSMSKSWATENSSFNISSNSVSPSFMLTNMTSDTDERIIEQMINEHPLKKLLDTDEVAEAVVFFVNASQHVNGTNLVINAGSNL